MVETSLLLGDHTVRIACDSAEGAAWLLEQFGAPPPGTDPPALSVTVALGRCGPFSGYAVSAAASTSGVRFVRADYVLTVDPTYRRAWLQAHDLFALKHALMNLYSVFIVHHEWGLLIHSACVLADDLAYVFSGPSGAGKSTAARLSFPRRVLANEATIFACAGERVLALDSYGFRSEPGHFARQGVRAPVRAVYLLRQSARPARRPLSLADGFKALYGQVFYWCHSPPETGKAMRLVRRLLDAVPVYQLDFARSDSFWQVVD